MNDSVNKVPANPAFRKEYQARINRVIDYIETHTGKPLSLEELAGVANFSRFHFHRIFGAMTGETLNQYIQRRRMEKAANALLSRPEDPVTDIALDHGFSGSAAFARAFKETYNMSATEWRSPVSGSSARNAKRKAIWVKRSAKSGKMAIPAGMYAIGHFNVTAEEFPEAWSAMVAGWLPDSGYQPADGPFYELYLNDPKDDPEGRYLVDIYFPVKPL